MRTLGLFLSPRQWTLNRPLAGRQALVNIKFAPTALPFSWLSEGQSPCQDGFWPKKCHKVHVWQMGELFGQCSNESIFSRTFSLFPLKPLKAWPIRLNPFWNTSFSLLAAISIIGFLFQSRDELIGKQAKTVEDEGGLFLPTDYSGPLSPHRPISLSDRSRPLNRAALQKIWICHSCCCWCGRTENQGQKSQLPWYQRGNLVGVVAGMGLEGVWDWPNGKKLELPSDNLTAASWIGIVDLT